jgi:pimeloyl-ACP methyl ester carboxylesterase
VPGDLPVFVVRQADGDARMVFLHGLCGHGHYYVDSFKAAAARKGTLIAVQADTPCGDGPYRDWTNSPKKLNDRIEAAFRALGDVAPLRDVVVIGYSSGALLSEMLAHRWPERYTRAILIASPQTPAAYRLRKIRSTVMMAGQIDRHDLMKAGMRDLRNAGIPSTFLVLPGATHGAMGPASERVMGDALDWLWEHDRPLPEP